ncbi:MAG: Asp-tRNA(Asn)/Glu-tRNA(Gln) amidotransferase subunit GatB [Candidatus Paceibacterota bacterium]|jgi:aspartyl-tRNA(Asn)/glutamyl-tRNA(Gln) amidotransferase subunit B
MANKYYPTIGLEIHAELKTETKMFCSCKNNPDEEKPNVNICPVCMAHPGALPVPNKKAIENVIKVGLAINGNIADFSEFDRKNYFYPDIPKGYQISQYKFPIVSGGHLADMDVTRVHLEEDTANNKHDRGDFSLIDFNRAGVPLMELVTEPHTFSDAEEAAQKATKFAKELQLILWYLGVSEANMEKGEMRVEANISISEDKSKLGTKVEVKNLNSFRSVERAIKYEVDRMTKLLEEGKSSEIVQETRGWDEGKQQTYSQRKKEGSADYRYFPDPDLPKLKLHEAFDLEKIKNELPELPEARRTKLREKGIKEEDVEVYINYREFGFWIEDYIKFDGGEKDYFTVGSNFFTTDVVGSVRKDKNAKLPDVKDFSNLIKMFLSSKLSSRSVKDIIALMVHKKIDPQEYAEKNNLIQSSDVGALKEIAQKIIDANAKVVADYKGGKEQAIMSLVGQMMKETKGSANPAVAKQVLIDLLK